MSNDLLTAGNVLPIRGDIESKYHFPPSMDFEMNKEPRRISLQTSHIELIPPDFNFNHELTHWEKSIHLHRTFIENSSSTKRRRKQTLGYESLRARVVAQVTL